jgi:hypothetical protein
MSMTYWIQTLDGRKLSQNDDDHSLMNSLADELDEACAALGIAPLSSFADYTDLELNMGEGEDESDEDGELDPETGFAYGIDDMQWFDVAAGLTCLEPLRKAVADKGTLKLDDEDRQQLIEELDDCIAKLKATPSTAKFHLAVIM